jgi:SEC-C motif-containing protein
MRVCPCGTGLAYASCCAPLHKGEREAEDAVSLMRSRFAAFAMKQPEYLWRTLHRDHEDRARPEEEILRELRAACSVQRYLGLTILESGGPGEDGVAHVVFAARVFRKGRDISFTERSAFRHDGVGWRYLSGELTPEARSP